MDFHPEFQTPAINYNKEHEFAIFRCNTGEFRAELVASFSAEYLTHPWFIRCLITSQVLLLDLFCTHYRLIIYATYCCSFPQNP